MFVILMFVIALVAWALHLMQQAIDNQEFSLMLAGFLVSSAAAALVGVYFLMGHYVVYMTEVSQHASFYSQTANSEWMLPIEEMAQNPLVSPEFTN
jgi:hypothetical protein